MERKTRALTPNLLKTAVALRAEGVGWQRLARQLSVSEYVLRCAIQTDYRQYKKAMGAGPRAERPPPAKRARRVNHAVGHAVSSKRQNRPSDRALAERDLASELLLQPRSVTAQLLGDPLPGRSALDQRQRK